jgi:hypothetical protein
MSAIVEPFRVEPRPTVMLTFASELEAAPGRMAFTLGFHTVRA